MECALWLNRRKVFSADEIKDNLDAASLLGYFAAGSLVKWLNCHGGADFADKLDRLSPNDPDILEKIAAIFGGEPTEYKTLGGASDNADAGSFDKTCPLEEFGSGAVLAKKDDLSLFSAEKGSLGSFSAGKIGSFGEFRTGGSFEINSSFGSGNFGLSWNFGSFWFGSFNAGSGFYEWEWELERIFGSFSKGSFGFGSGYAALLSMLKKSGSFGSFGFGSFGMEGLITLDIFGEVKNGSFVGKKLPDFFEKLDEYDRIMLMSLYGCPLNQFGYGIHNI